jgi:hypothetical protein
MNTCRHTAQLDGAPAPQAQSGLVNMAPGTLPASSNGKPESPQVAPELDPPDEEPELEDDEVPELDPVLPELLPAPELELDPWPPELEPEDVPLDPPDEDPDPLPEAPPEEPPLLEDDPLSVGWLVPQACAPRNAATAKSGGNTTSIRIPILSSRDSRARRVTCPDPVAPKAGNARIRPWRHARTASTLNYPARSLAARPGRVMQGCTAGGLAPHLRVLRVLAMVGGLAATLLFYASCAAKKPTPGFEPSPPRVYVAKVKNVLVGLPPTDAEVQAVEADPATLSSLVDAWMKRPEYGQKMMRFFQLAFQQTQIGANDFADQVDGQIGLNPSTTPLILQNVQESFARSMVAAEGHPFTEAMTTQQLMMTTALKELYAYLDTMDINDDGASYDHFRQKYKGVPIVVEASGGPIPVAQSVDPTSPNFLHWYDPDVATAESQVPGCQQDPMTLPTQAITLHWLLYGSLDGRKLANGTICPVFAGSPKATQFLPGDFADWTMVTLRQAGPGEATTAFYDLPALRAAHELVLRMPRAGFFSTPAFFANWQTNVSNQMRVTLNQALIVATGSSVDGTDPTYPAGTPGLDATHSSQAECFVCHKILDPSRSILSATWSWSYHDQQDPTWIAQPGVFAFRGVVRPVSSLGDFAGALASHPLVAPGWTQKLCHYVNSAPCDDADPEFRRIAALFATSGYSWNALVKALVTSPITTRAAPTRTATVYGETIAVARRNHLCAALGARLGLSDPCGLDALDTAATRGDSSEIVSGFPSDGYGRGVVAPILPNQPTLFFRAGTENLCESLAAQVVDAPAGSAPAGAKQWSSAQPDAAVADFVHEVMGLAPSDPRAGPSQDALKAHFVSAMKQAGTTATQALQSTFVAACLSPSVVSMGL